MFTLAGSIFLSHHVCGAHVSSPTRTSSSRIKWVPGQHLDHGEGGAIWNWVISKVEDVKPGWITSKDTCASTSIDAYPNHSATYVTPSSTTPMDEIKSAARLVDLRCQLRKSP